jgi:predicted RNase H-like HicB family nuclease
MSEPAIVGRVDASDRLVPGGTLGRSPLSLSVGGYPRVMPEMPRTLAAALHQEENWCIAQCLEVDVASQGHPIGEALANLAEAGELYLAEVDDPAGHVTAASLVTSFQLPAARARAFWPARCGRSPVAGIGGLSCADQGQPCGALEPGGPGGSHPAACFREARHAGVDPAAAA